MHPSYGMCLYGRIVLKWNLPFVNTSHNIIQLYGCVSFYSRPTWARPGATPWCPLASRPPFTPPHGPTHGRRRLHLPDGSVRELSANWERLLPFRPLLGGRTPLPPPFGWLFVLDGRLVGPPTLGPCDCSWLLWTGVPREGFVFVLPFSLNLGEVFKVVPHSIF
jgi:hypothetical protein